jgi:hypothetical protein
MDGCTFWLLAESEWGAPGEPEHAQPCAPCHALIWVNSHGTLPLFRAGRPGNCLGWEAAGHNCYRCHPSCTFARHCSR